MTSRKLLRLVEKEKLTLTKEDEARIDAVFSKFVGQERIKKLLKIHLAYCLRHRIPLPHILLFAPPGWGKTTLAKMLSDIMNSPIKITTGGNLSRMDDAVALIHSIEYGQIVLIDEIHRMRVRVEEEFYSVMQDFEWNGNKVPKFTLVGGTTTSGMINKPLRDRFTLQLDVEPYTDEQVAEIVKLHKGLDDEICAEIGKRSLGTPRVGLRLSDTIERSPDDLKTTFSLLGIDDMGFTRKHRQIMRYLQAHRRPVGLETVALGCEIDKSDISQVFERDLLKTGMIQRTPRGRILTPKGEEWLKTVKG